MVLALSKSREAILSVYRSLRLDKPRLVDKKVWLRLRVLSFMILKRYFYCKVVTPGFGAKIIYYQDIHFE